MCFRESIFCILVMAFQKNSPLKQAIARFFSRIFAKFSMISRSFSRFSQVFRSFRARSDVFGCVRMHSDAFGCIWMRSDASGRVWKISEFFGKFRKFCSKNGLCPASASPIATSGAWLGPGLNVLSIRGCVTPGPDKY